MTLIAITVCLGYKIMSFVMTFNHFTLMVLLMKVRNSTIVGNLHIKKFIQ